MSVTFILDGRGEIGFISSVTQTFCGKCTRARLSTDGKLYTCLFANKGYDLKELLKNNSSDEKISQMIQNVWKIATQNYAVNFLPQIIHHKK